MKIRVHDLLILSCLIVLSVSVRTSLADHASVTCCRPDHCLHVVAPDEIKARYGKHVPHPAFWKPDGWAKRGHQADRSFTVDEMVPLSGTYRMPVIIFGYSDYPIPEGLIELAQEVCEAPWPQRSVSAFYQQSSNGIFRIEFEYFIIDALPELEAFYEEGCEGQLSRCLPGHTRFLLDVVETLDDEVDFGQFDNDGSDGIPNSGDDDGFIDGAMFITPNCGGYDVVRDQWNIWPHATSWEMNRDHPDPEFEVVGRTDDLGPDGQPIRFGKASFQSLLEFHPDQFKEQSRIEGTFIHEMGHVLGCPDLYSKFSEGDSPETKWYGLGKLCQMASGDGQLSAWVKYKFGWADVIHVNGMNEEFVELPKVTNGNQILKIDLNYEGSQYFLAEYREDSHPFEDFGMGLMIYHVDESKPYLNPSNCSGVDPENHPFIRALQADGLCHLENFQGYGAYPYGEPADYWKPSTQDRWASDTFPGSLSYSGLDLGIEIREISQPGGDTITAVVSADVPPIVELTGPLDIAWVFDLSSSYEDDLEYMRDQIKDAIDEVEARYPGSRHNLSFFSDFPIWPYGVPGDIAYLNLSGGGFTENPRRVKQFIDSMTVFNGNDVKECQFEALYQVLTGEGRDFNGDGLYKVEDGDISPYDMDWNSVYTPAVIMMTDAAFHDGINEADYPFGDPEDPSDDDTDDRVAGRLDILMALDAHRNTHGHMPHIHVLDAIDPFVIGFDQWLVEDDVIWTELQQQAMDLAQWSSGGYITAGQDTVLFKQAVRKVLDTMALSAPRGGSCCIGGGVDCDENITAQQCAERGGSFLPHNWRCDLDCDGDGKSDACELLLGSMVDQNNNGNPDACECLGDIDDDGEIEIDDLLKVVNYWGEWMGDTTCVADFDRDWEVGIEDLLYVLNRWGNCNP